MRNRRFRVWHKKRGDRRTWSPRAASVGEAVLCAGILLLGFFALCALIASRGFQLPIPSSIASGPPFWPTLVVLAILVTGGGLGLLLTVVNAGTSAERRRMLAHNALSNGKTSHEMINPRQFPSVPSWDELDDSPGTRLDYRLPSATGPSYHVLALACHCLLWLGALAVLLVWISGGLAHDRPKWMWAVVALAVAGITARQVYIFLRQIRELIRIGPTCLEISQMPLVPGGRCEVSLTQAGKLHLASVSLTLICEERAEYRAGTNHRCETRRVQNVEVFRVDGVTVEPQHPFERRVEFVVPAGAMHSFGSHSNAIRWSFEVVGAFTAGGSFGRRFSVIVVPRAPRDAGWE